MAGLLTDLLAAGLIEKLEGDDERFARMERAAKTVAQELRDHPPGLIRAILAGLDPDAPENDPAIVQAERALVAEWKSMRSVHPSAPVGLLRAILIEACDQAADGKNAAILWLTAADTLPLMRLGKEEATLRQMLETLATRTEAVALALPLIPASANIEQAQAALKLEAPAAATTATPRKVNRQDLLLRVAATAGPQYPKHQLTSPNPHWTNQPGSWSHEFSDRMRNVLADELDELAENILRQHTALNQQLQASQVQLIKSIRDALAAEQRWVLDALKTSEARRQAEQVRLNALWWSEALYSQSMRCSYRELPPPLAAVVMAVDLLGQVTKPTPASVGYLLAEAVHRLPDAGFERKHTLTDLLAALRKDRGLLPSGWMDRLSTPPTEGRLSLRDLVFLALANREWNLEDAMGRAGLTGAVALSLPALARALFRQEQAVQVAGSAR